ncbi:type 2 isopentenyl-diphosphate Delta-isomerase [Idiomarina seosinensis]|uniref:type 2 isopentenyl-diphosphate Delta-isomerase n=1 Tax=Idiomarina seosinensis TaxID=281739 RepID=UPI0038510829
MDRKKSHIELADQQQTRRSDFDYLSLQHCALPDFNFSAIKLNCQFLEFPLSAPIMISSMTGGTEEANRINQHLAEAARETGIALGIGSQRISFEGKNNQGLTQQVRHWAGQIPVFGNVGLANLIKWQQPDCLNRLAEQVGADAMIIHLNPMQEIFQDNGDTDWQNSFHCLRQSIEGCHLPVIIKEVGMGLSPDVALHCQKAGAAAIDVAGKGGTRFIDIEGAMAADPQRQQAAASFADWGQSTVHLLKQYQKTPVDLPLIASGGIRNGLDIAKCLALGASMTSVAGRILSAARSSTTECIATIEQLKFELRIACWGSGSSTIKQLQEALISE